MYLFITTQFVGFSGEIICIEPITPENNIKTAWLKPPEDHFDGKSVWIINETVFAFDSVDCRKGFGLRGKDADLCEFVAIMQSEMVNDLIVEEP